MPVILLILVVILGFAAGDGCSGGSGCAGPKYEDNDGDGYSEAEGDCYDRNPDVYPGAHEDCDNHRDDDCDGDVDEIQDEDEDGDPNCDSEGNPIDCDDANPELNTRDYDEDGASTCDGDCNDSDVCDPWGDDDDDGESSDPYRDPDCGQYWNLRDYDDDGYTTCGGDGDANTVDDDCDDFDDDTYPSADEICDQEDNDCDGAVPEDEFDGDGDGFMICQGDCDDSDSNVNPEAYEEACDYIDNDCDGDLHRHEVDDDGDGVDECEGDCNDDNDEIHPGANEVACNGTDDDCDDALHPDEVDNDGDGFDECNDDCDDSEDTVYPGADEVCDGLDNDCNGATDEDQDGDGFDACDDCDEGDPDSHPGAEEVADGQDNDCDGFVDDGWLVYGADLQYEVEVYGENSSDDAGSALCGCGDITGDGLADFLVGAPYQDVNGSNSGKAYVVSGDQVWLGTDLDLGAAWAELRGPGSYYYAGSDVACLDDLDGDGLAEVVVGAQGQSSMAGTVYVERSWGLSGGGDFELSAADVALVGEAADDDAGVAVAGVGDVDGDSRGDLLVGAPGHDTAGASAGRSYLIYGSGLLGSGDELQLADADVVFEGEAAGDRSGEALDGGGLVDGDAVPEFLIGAPQADAGVVYVINGADASLTPFQSLSSAWWILEGEDAGDAAGSSVAFAGDVDGDGADDLLIGAPMYGSGAQQSAGRAYLILGSQLTAGGGILDLGMYSTTFFDGAQPADLAGSAVSSAGDVNEDGYDDILIGAPENDDGGSASGHAYVFLGSYPMASGTFSLTSAFGSFVGESSNDYAGGALGFVEDLNGNGTSELLIGAAETTEGSVYVVLP